MLLTFSRDQMMHNLSYAVACAEVTCNEYFTIQ